MRFENSFELPGGAVARPDPDYFWWRSQQKTLLAEIGVFGDDREPMQPGIFPDQMIGRRSQIDFTHMDGFRECFGKNNCQSVRQVLIEEQFQADTVKSLRSRSAAKARQARISSAVRSGKSRIISSADIPDARYSRTSDTLIRKPRMQGFPPRLSGSIVIRPS